MLKSPPDASAAAAKANTTTNNHTYHVTDRLRGQSPNSLVDVLKKQAASPPRKQGDMNEVLILPRTSTADVNNNNEGPIVQANLEESYFHGPNSSQTENITMDKPDNNDTGESGNGGDNTAGIILEEIQQNDNNMLQPKSDVEENEQMQRAMAESRAMSSTKPHQLRNRGTTSTETEVIVLDDSDDESEVDNDRKMPANVDDNTKIKGESSLTAGVADTSINNEESEESQLDEAIRLSLLEAKEEERTKQYYECGGGLCRKLSRPDFKEAIDSFVWRQGGYEKLESGSLIKHGNANDMSKSKVAAGGGKNQTSAQYGRYSIDRMWRVFDVLEGKADINIEEEAIGARKPSPTKGKQKKQKGKQQKSSPGDGEEKVKERRLDGLSGAKIKAFVDIGHGIGIQVLQAGWAHSVPARGVEIMKERHLVAESIRVGVVETLRKDPPDDTLVELKCEDFSKAIVGEDRDEQLRSFLLLKDKPTDVQKGLVIFINNAEDVFAARSNQNAKSVDLDAHLATLFANMKVGGRMVTLTDVSRHLCQSSEWFSRDVFDSGNGAVSWGNQNKSVDIYVLTKLSDYWECRDNKCPFKKSQNTPAQNAVVNENGDLCEVCVYCDVQAKRCTRVRKSKRRREEEGY